MARPAQHVSWQACGDAHVSFATGMCWLYASQSHTTPHLFSTHLQDTSQNLCNKTRSWLTGLSAPREEVHHDVRWRLVSVRGVGLPLIQRYMEGRNEIEQLGMQPGIDSYAEAGPRV